VTAAEDSVIRTEGLTKRYGPTLALDAPRGDRQSH
jgi:hypothetical protein